MTQLSLGLIETAGLTAAVTAADAAMKSANVELVGYELAKGSGMATVKVLGDIGAVKAAVAGAAAGSAVGRIVSASVIARPAGGIGCMIASKETVGAKTEKSRAPATELPADAPPSGTGSPADEEAILLPEREAENGTESELPPDGSAPEIDAQTDMATQATAPAEPEAQSGTEPRTKTTDTISLRAVPAKEPAGKTGKKSRK